MEPKIIILIILSSILLYVLSGFLPGRVMKRKRNRWQAWGFFGQIWGYIDGDKKRILPVPMPPGMGPVFTSLSRTEEVEDGKLEEWKGKSKEGKTITYNKAIEIPGIDKPIRTVVEEVCRLRKIESHPYLVKVPLPKTGGTFYLVFTVKTKIKNPNKTIKFDEFLLFVGNQLSDRVRPWVIDWEATAEARHPGVERSALIDMIIDEIIGLKIDDDDSIKFMFNGKEINLKAYMNLVVGEFGGEIADFSLKVGYDANIAEILRLRLEQKLELERQKDEQNKSLTRNIVRERELADANQDRELDQKYMDDVAIPQLEAQAEAQKKANSAWQVDVLTLGDEQKAPSLIMQQRPNSKRKGGTV